MTNAEKFKEDWGFEPNVTHCPKCGRESCMVCPYAEKRFEECASDWWHSEYQGEPTIPLSVIEKIKANIDKLPDLNPDYPMDMTTHVSKWAVFEIIDNAVKECTHEHDRRNY